MLRPGENERYFDTKETGLFAEMYALHGGGEVPVVLHAVELLTAGEKVMAERSGSMLFAGTVRDRPYGFLPYTVKVTRSNPGDNEVAIVEVPLHYHNLESSVYGHLIVGGGYTREWVNLGTLVLRRDSIQDAEICGTTLSVGSEQIARRRASFLDLTIPPVLDLLVDMPDDTHIAVGSAGIKGFDYF